MAAARGGTGRGRTTPTQQPRRLVRRSTRNTLTAAAIRGSEGFGGLFFRNSDQVANRDRYPLAAHRANVPAVMVQASGQVAQLRPVVYPQAGNNHVEQN